MTGLFNTNIKHKSIADKITIKTLEGFIQSINQLKQNGLSKNEYKGLVLAQNRAKAQLKRKNLSPSERMDFLRISNIKIPSWRKY